jgi:hypothetical protein
VHNISHKDISHLGRASLNVLRDPGAAPVGDHLKARFGAACIPSFPCGIAGTLRFLEMTATACGVPVHSALLEEISVQEEVLAKFSDLAGTRIAFNEPGLASPVSAVIHEVATSLKMKVSDGGFHVPVPLDLPVGTAGIHRMLHRWRRAIHA